MAYNFEKGKEYLISGTNGAKKSRKPVRPHEFVPTGANTWKRRLVYNGLTNDKKYDFISKSSGEHVYLISRNITAVEE